MSWIKVCDRIVDHRKWIALEVRGDTDAMALWLVGACRSNATAGLVHDHRIGTLLGIGHPRELAAAGALVACGLWDRVPGGYQIHDWADYQPSPGARERNTRRVKEWREKQRCNALRNGDSVPQQRGNALRNGDSVTRYVTTVTPGDDVTSRNTTEPHDVTRYVTRDVTGVTNAVPSRPVTDPDPDSDAREPDPLATRPPYQDRGLLPDGREREPREPSVPYPPELYRETMRALRAAPNPFRPRDPYRPEGES